MKRVLLSIAVLLVLLCGIAVAEEVSIVASGECGKNGSNLTWALDSAGTLTISGQGEMESYSDNDPPWYAYRESIMTAVIKEGVTSIGNDAFFYYSKLSSIDLPKSLTRINEYAFAGCSSLISIVIPHGVVKIGNSAFVSCSNLTHISIPSSVTSIGDAVFGSCSNLTRFLMV